MCFIFELLNDDNYHEAIADMQALQDLEKSFSKDRTDGKEMATKHLAYLVEYTHVHKGEIILARENDLYCGFIVYYIEEFETADLHVIDSLKIYGEVSELYIRPNWRKKNLGKKLLDHAEQYFIERGIKRVKLTVLAKNKKACDFYSHMDYAPFEIVYQKYL